MSKTTTEGLVAFHVSVRVSATQMRDWEPERIAAFFNGIAIARLAADGAALSEIHAALEQITQRAPTAETSQP